MNKAELIDAIASESGLTKADAKKALDGFVTATAKCIENWRQNFSSRIRIFLSF